MVIHFNGKVPLCGCDFNNAYTLGDVNVQNIQEVWKSENYEKIRKIHSSGNRNEIPLCIGCNIWNLDEKYVYEK